MRLSEFFHNIYRLRRLPGRTTRTISMYDLLFNQFSAWLGHEATLADLTEEKIVAYLDCKFRGGWSPRSVNRARDQILALSRYAVLKGLLREIPDIQPHPEPKRLPTIYEPQDVSRLLGACRWLDGSICGIAQDRWWIACLLLCYDTGARPAALLKLRWADIDLARRTILLRAETQKQNADQVVRIHPTTVEALRAIAHPPRELLLPWPGISTSIYYWFGKLHRLAGLTTTKQHRFKKFRATCATLAHRAGLDASAQLGHSDPRVTRRHYIAPEPSGAADVIPRPSLPRWLTSPSETQQFLF